VPNEAADEVLSQLYPGQQRSPILVAFDFERREIVAKPYFNPVFKAIDTKTPANTVVFNAIRKCNGPAGSYDASIEVLNDYLNHLMPAQNPKLSCCPTIALSTPPHQELGFT
jgi:hypothetical protein